MTAEPKITEIANEILVILTRDLVCYSLFESARAAFAAGVILWPRLVAV
jgi:hypothetical protein